MSEGNIEEVRSHYGRLLALPTPWYVEEVQEDLKGLQIRLVVTFPSKTKMHCPECGKACPQHDRTAMRTWRHLGVLQYKTYLQARVPRCKCPEHGVRTIKAPWAEDKSRWTLLFEAEAIAVIQASRSIRDAAKLLKLDWHSVHRIMARAVERGEKRRTIEEVESLGLDEKSFQRGHDYVSVMTDIGGRRVLDVERGRDTESARRLLRKLPQRQRHQVRSVALDMSGGYQKAAQLEMPLASVVHDRFHVSKHLNEAVDQTRRKEHRQLVKKGDNSLSKTRFLWLKGRVVEGDRKEHFEWCLEQNYRTANAWMYKDQFIEFWHQEDSLSGQDWFRLWFDEVMGSKLPAVQKVAKMLQRHLRGLLNYFAHPITNALSEGFNSRIQAIKADARGFRSFQNYRTRILFFCGKLNLTTNL